MAYEKTNWQDTFKDAQGNVTQEGTKITASRLNKMEDGIAGSASKQELTVTNQQLAETIKLNDTGVLDLNIFNEQTRSVLQGLEPGQINAVLGKNNVTVENAAFINKSVNMFNPATIEKGFVINSAGVKTAHSSYSLSEFIAITPSAMYATAKVNHISYFGADKTFLSRKEANLEEYNTMSRPAPANAYYMRIGVQNTQVSNAQLNEGGILFPYVNYQEPELSEKIKLKKGVITSRELSEKSVDIRHAAFIDKSINMFNKYQITEKHSQDGTNSNLIPNSLYSVSGFIQVRELQPYSTGSVSRINFFDKMKNFISSTTGASFVAPANTHYCRLTVLTAQIDNAQINEGSSLLPYDEFYFQVGGVDIQRKDEEEESITADVSNKDYFVIDGVLDGVYSAPTFESVARSSANPIDNKTAADVIALYDDLVTTYPYVTKTQVGTDSAGNPLNRYDFTPAYTPIEPGTPTGLEKPKIFITSGTHGNEKAAVWVLYQALRQLCENWSTDDRLETLRWNVEFVVMPMVNPSGWNANTRQNSNGVDINRQSPTGWVGGNIGDVTYGGTAPLTEPEAIAVNNILQNEENIIYYCDFHNFSANAAYFIWNAGGTLFNMNIGENLISKMTRKWKKEIPSLEQDETTLYGYVGWTPGGTMARHAPTLGIQASTFEISHTFIGEPEAYTAATVQRGVEAFLNWLVMNLRNNIRIY